MTDERWRWQPDEPAREPEWVGRPASFEDVQLAPEPYRPVVAPQAEPVKPAPVARPMEPKRPSLWERLTGAVSRSARISNRLHRLNQAIALYPESPSNYVLRGELYLDIGERELAAADFRTALRLAEAQVQNGDWGIAAQAAQDRALVGLEKALRRR